MEERLATRAGDRDLRVMASQIADVTKLVAPVRRITTRGHRCVLDDDGDAELQQSQTGRKVKLHKERNDV